MQYNLSPSTINLYTDCPKCFWLHIVKKFPRPAGIFPSLPSGMDRVFKKHFDSYMEKNQLPPALKDLDEKPFSNKELLEVWRNNRKGIIYTDKNGNILRGAIDTLLQKGKKLIVLDYKTRGYPVKEDTADYYKNQLDIYNFLLRKNNYETEDYSYILFYIPKEVDAKGDVVFDAELVKMNVDIQNAEKLFNDAIKLLQGEMPNSSDECQYCKYKNNFEFRR